MKGPTRCHMARNEIALALSGQVQTPMKSAETRVTEALNPELVLTLEYKRSRRWPRTSRAHSPELVVEL